MDDLTPAAPQGYSLVAPIGRGASSVVWEAQRLATGSPVALKILEADVSDPDALRRFEREREAMTALARHRNILTIVDAGTRGVRPWLAMELCRRGSLASYVADGGPLDLPTTLRVLDRLTSALAVAHDAGVVHCDIKPANVMLTDGGEPALGDFGIARVSVGRATTTTVGGFSLDHVAPELLDDGKRSPQSDVYSLGTTAWELLAGHPPFRQSQDVSVGAVLTRILRQPLPESEQIPTEVLALLRRMAAKTPEERPASMVEVGEAVRQLAAGLRIELAEQVLPVLTPVQAEVLTMLPGLVSAGVDPQLGVADTHRRLRPPPVASLRDATRRKRRVPLTAAASLVTVVAVGGAAFGVYGFVAAPAPAPIPAPVAQQEPSSPTPTPSVTTTTVTATPEPTAVEEPPPSPRRRTPTRRPTARRSVAPPPPTTTEAPTTTEEPDPQPVPPIVEDPEPVPPIVEDPEPVPPVVEDPDPYPPDDGNGELTPVEIPVIPITPITGQTARGKVYPAP